MIYLNQFWDPFRPISSINYQHRRRLPSVGLRATWRGRWWSDSSCGRTASARRRVCRPAGSRRWTCAGWWPPAAPWCRPGPSRGRPPSCPARICARKPADRRRDPYPRTPPPAPAANPSRTPAPSGLCAFRLFNPKKKKKKNYFFSIFLKLKTNFQKYNIDNNEFFKI